MVTYLQLIYTLLCRWILNTTSGLINPQINAGTGTRTPQTNAYFNKIFAMADTVIASAKDRNGTAVSGLAGFALTKNITLEFPLSEYTLTSGTVIEYQTPVDLIPNT